MKTSAERSRIWRAANLERDRENKRRYYAQNSEKWVTSDWAVAGWKRKKAREAADRAWLAAIKLERGCEFVLDDGSVCGWRDHPSALEFDHRDPTVKEFTVSARPGLKRERLVAEMAKCDVLCANHHRIRTVTEKHYLLGREIKEQPPTPQLSLFEESA